MLPPLLGLVVVAVLAIAVPAPSDAAEPPPATATTAATEPPAPDAGGDSGVGDLDVGANTPSPRGEPAPPRTQRIADSAIAVGLLVVLAGGVAVAVWTARRGSGAGPPDGSGDGVGGDAGEPVGGPQRGR